MKKKRIMLAAPRSGSGKTLITCGLLQVLKAQGEKVVSFKCGPDYIDPMFHEKAIGIPSTNLDTFFTGEKETRSIFARNSQAADFAVLEGVMGLYDGLGGVREEGSSYHLAKITKTPIILIVDTKGMGRSIVAEIAGFLAFDTEKLIKGVILNRMSKHYYEILKPILEEELQIAVIGYFPQQKELTIESRHLGLQMPHELTQIKQQLKQAGEELEKCISLPKLNEIAVLAEELPEVEYQKAPAIIKKERAVIAVARDEAFCFYYKENLRLLEEYGATLQFFSPLHDKKLPQSCAGLLLGGGYPELYARQLSENVEMREQIQKAAQRGLSMVAECGGFMYLHKELTTKEGETFPMAGVLPQSCFYAGKLVRFGYIELQEKNNDFLSEGKIIKGHEFHYYDSTDNGQDCIATKPVTGTQYSCVCKTQNSWLGFAHLYYPSQPAFAERFVNKVKRGCIKTIS